MMLRTAMQAGAVAAALVTAGCANPSRSRDLGNPQIAGATLARQVCSNCHGVTGVSVSPNFPILAAQVPEYIVKQLQEFKSHDRQDPAGFVYMWGLSRSLTDAQMRELASYYAGQPAAPGRGELQDGRGGEIYRSGLPGQGVPACAGCHGDAAQGNGQFPRLAGQHADYVIKQLVVFKVSEQRPAGAMMKVVAHDLRPQDMRDVAAFLQSLPAR
jgi:cytochrome c553